MRECTYSDGTAEYPAVQLSWHEVEEALGRPHLGTPEDDRRLIAWTLAHGGPAWAKDSLGFIDEHGWGLYSPQPVAKVAVVARGDIARLAGVAGNTVSKWVRRHADFPRPVQRTSGGALYDLAEVKNWLRRTGRLK